MSVPTREVTLREMVEAMSRYADDETFRWHAVGDANLRVTMGQVRGEVLSLEEVVREADVLQGPVILPTASSGLSNALREMRRREGLLFESWQAWSARVPDFDVARPWRDQL